MKKVLHYVSSMKRAVEETFIMNVYRNIDRNKVSFDFLVTDNEEGDYDKEIYSMGGKIYHIHFSSPLLFLTPKILLTSLLHNF